MPLLTEQHFHEATSPLLRTSAPAAKDNNAMAASAPANLIHGDWSDLPEAVREWVEAKIEVCKPDVIHLMTGTDEEDARLKSQLVAKGVIIKLPKYDNCFLARTDPKDVARVESRTFICTPDRLESIPEAAPGIAAGALGNWISPEDLEAKENRLFPGCMVGRTMYVIPYSMGPVDSPLSKKGIELTDSAYVAVSMRVMTRVCTAVLEHIGKSGESFVKCLHSVGHPLRPDEVDVPWPCNPADTFIAHRPHDSEIISFGSGYGGNSLLGKKCFALRIGSALARQQGWLAEHMLIMGVEKTDEPGSKKYICAAFPSACGKTNLAMLCPTVPGYKVTCVGDDIAWLRFDSNGDLRAINPENGFFGVAPGTSRESNPVAMDTIFKDTLFTNVAMTDDGGVWWEGIAPKQKYPAHLIDWTGRDWTPACGRNAAHPNSRFCSPASNCPILDPAWEDPAGVKIDAILFGGRRPHGVPLVSEARDWRHGVFLGAALKSESTAAAEHIGKTVMHDPFSMRPFFGYNFGDYLKHWLSLGERPGAHLPKIFMVNWFRRSRTGGGFLWPGFGDNIRVIDWVLRRCSGAEPGIVTESPIGGLPVKGALNMTGLADVDWDELFSIPPDFWRDEVAELRTYFHNQVGRSLPEEIDRQLDILASNFAEGAAS